MSQISDLMCYSVQHIEHASVLKGDKERSTSAERLAKAVLVIDKVNIPMYRDSYVGFYDVYYINGKKLGNARE